MADGFDTSDFVPDSANSNVFSAHDFVPDQPPSVADDVKGVAKSLPERFAAGLAMALPNTINGIAAGPQYLGRGIADTIEGNPTDKNFKPWQPFYSSEDALHMLPEAAQPYDPKTAIGSAVNDIGQQAMGAVVPAAMKAIPEIAGNIGSGLKSMADDFATKYPNGGPFDEWGADSAIPKDSKDVSAFKAQKVRNISYAEGINANAENMKQSYGQIYDKAADISKDTSISAPNMRGNVESLLDDLEGDSAHKTEAGSSQAFRDLKAVTESFDGDGNIPLHKFTLLKKRINDLYSSDMGETRGKIYAQLNDQLNTLIKKAKVENPEWGTIMDSGNALFNNYRTTFDSPGLSNKTWSLGDKKEYEDAYRARNGDPATDMPGDPTSAPPSDETRDKIFNIHSVNSVSQFESMVRKIPPELRDQFTSDAVNASKGKNPRLASAIQTAYSASKQNYGSAIKNAAKILKPGDPGFNPAMAESFPHVEDAITYHTNIANDAHKKYLDDMNAALNPPPPLALPAPKGAVYVDTAGNASPMTENQATSTFRQQDLDSANAQLAKQNPVKPATQARYAQPPIKDMVLNAKNKAVDMGSALDNDPQISDIGKALLKSVGENGYKHGGAVNTNPSEAQKVAGNYKKAHVKFHGLDIAIENPRGSRRSGTGADGKPWASVMPDHYGYIKRTTGTDGDHIDVYLGQNKDSLRAYVIDQKDHETGKFDEHKIMLGFSNRDNAMKSYRAAFSDKKNRIMKMTRMDINELKDWLKSGNIKQPLRKAS